MIPIRNPLATMAGMIGTKMSPRSLIALINIFCFCTAASLASALELAVTPETAMNSSKTLLTVPVPRMI